MQRTLSALCLAIAFTYSNVNAIAFAEGQEQAMQTFLAAASTAQARGDFAAAAESYRKAAELDPSIPELWANLGLMYRAAGNHAEAIESFKRAESLNGALFVPQLFLGIEYLQSKNPSAALPHLEKAVRLKPNDSQAALSLGAAYEMVNRIDRSAGSYMRATEIDPNNGNAWLGLGTALLEQAENDARIMTSTYNNSAYVKLRAAETYAEEGKLSLAENAFKAAVASSSPIPCAHAEFGITLLREDKATEAREQFQIESRTASHCGLAALGFAVTDLAQGHYDVALKELTSIATADAGFVESSLPLFHGAISADQAKPLIELARSQGNNANLSVDIGSLVDRAVVSGDVTATISSAGEETTQSTQAPLESAAEPLYASGEFALCDEALKPSLKTLTSTQQHILASCSFSTGDYKTASIVAERLKSNPATAAEGFYWESRSDQKLAVSALIRAGEIDPDSPRLHVLTGNAFRQQRRWSDAEGEYRKAVALDPKSRAARLSLAIVLFTELKTEEALNIDKSLLTESPDDPEANLLAAEILVQDNRFEDAEPYLANCRNLKPELVPRVHILRGQVYAETGKIAAAIAEYKLGVAGDEDGSVHYRLARLYQRTGDKAASAEEIRLSKQLRERWDNQAHLDLGQPLTETSQQ